MCSNTDVVIRVLYIGLYFVSGVNLTAFVYLGPPLISALEIKIVYDSMSSIVKIMLVVTTTHADPNVIELFAKTSDVLLTTNFLDSVFGT